MTGSLLEKKGKFYMILRFKEGGKWKQTQRATGLSIKNNKTKAEKMLKEYLVKNNDDDLKKSNQIMFTDYLKQWLEDRKEEIKLVTWECYRYALEVHILPYFRPMKLTLKEVKPRHIFSYFEHKSKSGSRKDGKDGGLAISSLRKHKIVLSLAFQRAKMQELVEFNPALEVKIPKQDNKKKIWKMLDGNEADALLDVSKEHKLYPFILITLWYGLRKSEALGLKWSAIDFEKDEVHINHTVVMARNEIVRTDETKNIPSERTYPLLPEIKGMLLKLKEKQATYKKEFGNCYDNNDYVLKHEDGKPFRPDYIRKPFNILLDYNSLPRVRIHDLRHSCASLLYKKGWAPEEVQKWLGHADVRTTQGIYIHFNEMERKKELAEKLGTSFAA